MMPDIKVGMSASASSGNAARLGNYSVVGGGGSSGGGMTRNQWVMYVMLALVAVLGFIVFLKRK